MASEPKLRGRAEPASPNVEMSQSASHSDIAGLSSTNAPSESRLVRFADLLLQPLRNGVYRTKEFHGRGVKIVNMGELFGHPRLADIPMKRVELSSSELEKSQLRTGDLLFARRSLVAEGAGRCCLVRDIREPTTFESSIIRARPDGKQVLSEYLFYFFSSPQGRELMRTILRQVAVSGITGSDLAELKIPVPSLHAQRHSVAILGALDDRIELLRQTNVTLEAIAQALFKSWFVDFDPVRAKAEGREPDGMDAASAALFPDSFEDSPLGPIPQGWHVASLSDCMELNPQRVLRKGSLASYLDMANAPTQGHRPAEITQRELGSGSKFINGDTLLAKITPCLENGKTAFVDFLADNEVGWGSTEFIVMRPKAPLPPFWGYLLARTPNFRAFAIQAMTGTSGRQRVELGRLKQFSVAVPDDGVAEAFGKIIEPMRARIAAASSHADNLSKLRDTLLPRLISGKLRLPEVSGQIEEAIA